jgi:hypothetical protein
MGAPVVDDMAFGPIIGDNGVDGATMPPVHLVAS